MMIEFIYVALDRCAPVTFIIMTLVALVTPFVPILRFLACYGKTRYSCTNDLSSCSKKSGCWIDNTEHNKNNNRMRPLSIREFWNGLLVPKQFFTHFYVLGIVSFLCHRGYCGWQIRRRDRLFLGSLAVEVVFMVHLVRRLLECLTVHEWRRGSHMHLVVYLGGFVYYLFLPFLLFPIVDGSEKNHDTQTDWQTDSSLNNDNTPYRLLTRIVLLSLFCLWAQFQQFRHHWILANLRRCHRPKQVNRKSSNQPESQQRTGNTTIATTDQVEMAPNSYELPLEGWFEFISCPHYTAEILLYFGLTALNECNCDNVESQRFRSTVMMAWVVTNLTVLARVSHSWYASNFPPYAHSHRWAIIPFIV